METKKISNDLLDGLYTDEFRRCVAYTRGLLFIKDKVSRWVIEYNIETARDYYQKIENKTRIPIFSLRDLNGLEEELDMGVAQ